MGLGAGDKLGAYEILGTLGAGGMGEVFRARDARLNRDVAIKVLPAALREDAGRLRRFEQEARATGALNHPNVLAVYDVGEHDGAPFLVAAVPNANRTPALNACALFSSPSLSRSLDLRATDFGMRPAATCLSKSSLSQ